MRKVTLPSATVEIDTFKNGKAEKESYGASRLLREMVLVLPYWKANAELERIDSCIELEELTVSNSSELQMSDDCWKHLKEAMQLKDMAPIPNLEMNKLYMLTFRAVVKADRA